MKNILIAVNSFKGTADAVEVSKLFDKYLNKSLFHVLQKPVSDGGDGFLEVCKFYFDLEILEYSITTPFNESTIECKVGLDRNNKTLYIESAEVLGLKKISKNKRHPLSLSSKGFGDLLDLISRDVDELKYEAEKIIIGVGGTGTIDMGLGLCSQFGLKLFDEYGSELEVLPKNYNDVADIEFNKPDLPFSFEIILDVNNHLLGDNGGILFAHQKGASNADLNIIESGWGNIAKILKLNKLTDTDKELYGAGGGISIGLNILADSKIKTAKDFILHDLKIDQNEPDMVITGEGSFDEQSFMGKGAGVIINLFEEKNIPVVLCCGKIDPFVSEKLSMNVFPMELKTYINDPINNFEKAIEIACNEISGMTDILTKIS
ncbi:MAG: glycerate kinase [Ignavibacteriales bacterium]|nr:MAG: glycerate kinase [Ignavibacteriales bacterium]